MYKHKVILGGGLSGLIYATLNPDYILITQSIGGLAKEQWFAPFMIHWNLATQSFLQMLGIEFRVKLCKVGYCWGGMINDYLPEEFGEMYYEKSRGRKSPACEYKKRAVSKWAGNFYYFDLDIARLIGQMVDLIDERLFLHEIKKVDFGEQTIWCDDKIYYNYTKLVSTLPAPIFFGMIEGKRAMPDFKFEFTPKTFIRVSASRFGFDFEGYDYVYFPEKDEPRLRLTKIENSYDIQDECIAEYAADFLEGMTGEKSHEVPYAYILEPKEIQKFENVEYVGRFAEWKDELLIHNLIERLFWR